MAPTDHAAAWGLAGSEGPAGATIPLHELTRLLTSNLSDRPPHPLVPPEQGVAGVDQADRAAAEERAALYAQMAERVAELQHAHTCPWPDDWENSPCPRGVPNCRTFKQLWRHVTHCRKQFCSFPHCISSRFLVVHFRDCIKQHTPCPVCDPALELIEARRQARFLRGGGGGPAGEPRTVATVAAAETARIAATVAEAASPPTGGDGVAPSPLRMWEWIQRLPPGPPPLSVLLLPPVRLCAPVLARGHAPVYYFRELERQAVAYGQLEADLAAVRHQIAARAGLLERARLAAEQMHPMPQHLLQDAPRCPVVIPPYPLQPRLPPPPSSSSSQPQHWVVSSGQAQQQAQQQHQPHQRQQQEEVKQPPILHGGGTIAGPTTTSATAATAAVHARSPSPAPRVASPPSASSTITTSTVADLSSDEGSSTGSSHHQPQQGQQGQAATASMPGGYIYGPPATLAAAAAFMRPLDPLPRMLRDPPPPSPSAPSPSASAARRRRRRPRPPTEGGADKEEDKAAIAKHARVAVAGDKRYRREPLHFICPITSVSQKHQAPPTGAPAPASAPTQAPLPAPAPAPAPAAAATTARAVVAVATPATGGLTSLEAALQQAQTQEREELERMALAALQRLPMDVWGRGPARG